MKLHSEDFNFPILAEAVLSEEVKLTSQMIEWYNSDEFNALQFKPIIIGSKFYQRGDFSVDGLSWEDRKKKQISNKLESLRLLKSQISLLKHHLN